MEKISKALQARLLAAQSAEEAAALMEGDGQKLTAEDAAQLWDEIKKGRKQDDRELSVDELDAVSGGEDRDWVKDGCAATVEYGSRCGSNDKCILFDVIYENGPLSETCPICGTSLYKDVRWFNEAWKNSWYMVPTYFTCKTCGYSEFAYYENEWG